MGRLERMKHDGVKKRRDERSNGIEILMVDPFVKINPTDPLRLFDKEHEGREIDPIPPVVH
jgi:hypothetical protein